MHFLLLVLTIFFAWRISGDIIEYIFAFLNIESGSEITNFLKNTLRFFLIIIIRLFIIMIYLSIYKYLVLFLMAPLFAYLSEITEEKLTGKTFQFNLKRFIKDVIRGILMALRNLIIELIWILVLFIVAFIPVVGFFSPLLLFLVESYFFGFSMMDYYNERHKLSVKESVRFMQKHKGAAIGVGATYYLLFLIPFIGWLFAPVYASVSGTIAAHRIHNPRERPE